MTPPLRRDYAAIAARLRPAATREAAMQAVVDALWNGLHDADVSWVGFYLPAGHDQLVLGPRRDKPACSPIGLHGVCGKCFLTREPQIVQDVTGLGPDYIACDPRDRSEVVVPLVEAGVCWSVLDLDSHSVGAFGARDVAGLQQVLRAAGLIESAIPNRR